MLATEKSAPNRRWKYGLLLPVLALFALLFHQTVAQAQKSDPAYIQYVRNLEASGWEQLDTIITFDPQDFHQDTAYKKISYAPVDPDGRGLVYQAADEMPEFPGGEAALQAFIEKNMRNPAGNTLDGYQVGVEFIVEKDGTVSQLKHYPIQQTTRPALVEEAFRVIRLMPKWDPARHRGKAVRHRMMIPIRF